MNLTTMREALTDLGRGRWTSPQLGMANSGQPTLWEIPWGVLLAPRFSERWIWPDDLAVGFEVEWLRPVEVGWLEPVEATIAQPINLVGLHNNEPIIGIAGLIVCPGWTDRHLSVEDFEECWVIGLPNERGEVADWECASLATALELLHEVEALGPKDLTDRLGLTLVDELTGNSGSGDVRKDDGGLR